MAITKHEKYIITKRVQQQLRNYTKGWKLLVLCKDGSETLVPLKDLKKYHLIEVSEFAKEQGIDYKPMLAWWVHYTWRKCDFIISATKTCIRKTTHNSGIEIPTNVKHAYKTNEKNGNAFWKEALQKEIHNFGI